MLTQSFLCPLEVINKNISRVSRYILWFTCLMFATSSYAFAGSISGSVTDSEGNLLKGVYVTLSTKENDSWSYLKDITTDNTGKYIFSDLSANDYSISFNAKGYVYEFYNNARYENQVTPISLTENENKILTNVALVKNGILRGTVKNATGQLLKSVRVVIYEKQILSDGSTYWWKTTRFTDEQGQYIFDGYESLEPGKKYRLGFSNSLYGQSYYDYGIEFYDNVATLNAAADIVMTPSEERTIDVVVGDLGRGTIEGIVTDNDDNVLPGASVSIYYKKGDEWDYFDQVSSDSDGKYTFTNLPVNEYLVHFELFYSNAAGEMFISEYFDNSIDQKQATVIFVGADENKTADAQLDKQGIIRGTVKDILGQPIEGVAVDIYRAYDASDGSLTWPDYPVYTIYTDSDGQYVFNNYNSLEPGVKYRLKFSSLTNGVEFYQNVAIFDKAKDIVMQVNEVRRIDVVLGDIVSGSINGTVMAKNGKTLNNITVVLEVKRKDINSWDYVGSTKTDVNGNYSFKGLLSNEYRIHFIDENHDYVSEYFDNVTTADKAATLFLDNAETKVADAILDKRGVLRGMVKGIAGQPLKGVQVVVYYYNDYGNGDGGWLNHSISYTDGNGQYILDGANSLEPGKKYRIKFTSYKQDEYGDNVISVFEFYNDVTTIEEASDIALEANEERTIDVVLDVPKEEPGTPEVYYQVVATDATASEAGNDSGLFTITRTGNTDKEITIHFNIGGTAKPGVDYNEIGDSIMISAGASSATIEIIPIDDNDALENDETVTLELIDPVAGGSNGKSAYIRVAAKVVGSSATVTIINNGNVQAIPTLQTWTLILLVMLLFMVAWLYSQPVKRRW